MSSRVTVSGASRTSQTSQRRHRSRSTSRYADLEKPKKKKTLTATTSLVSIPNTIKLSMLNSGLLSFERVKLEARDANNSLSQTIPDKPIELRHFVKLCEQRRKFPVLYKLEFQTAVKVETNTCRHATRKNNIEKNQNQKCIPYDYNRVVLDKMESTPDSDYVNASYVDSLLKPNAYIVTQGPTEETVTEFWRMVWQENVSAIIMLTKTFDFTKVMCVQYWPASKDKDESYGDIYIGIVKEEQLANFQIRTFRIYKKSGTTIVEERHILQFHYTEWHSHTCPFSNAVLEFRRRVRSVVGNIIKANSMVGPMLVHCNDGGGRSGVYLAIDANMELAEEEDCFHVFGYLKKLRQSRKGLIENVDQYKFVYDTLEEHIVCGKSWFPVKELSDKLKQKSQKDVVTKMNEYQKEYTQICKQTPRFSIGDCAGGHRADNREKNRDVLCVPPDNFRPYLTSFQGNAFTDYINAVFVDGYTKPREYIVTEWPVQKTLGEFWSLVYDQECSAVVVICSPPPNSQQYPAFWPEKRKASQKYGPVFTVTCKASKHYTNIRTWEFNINKKIVSLTELMAGVKAPMKACAFFQLTCWPMGHKVPTSTNSLVELMNMVEQWREKADYGPVCVVSPDGRSRAGVYCAANACIEQVIQHGEVDIFQAVKTVRRHRPQLVENITEYKYCYDLVLHYVLHYLNKDLKEKKFIEFGRGKVIPLTPENSNSDLPNEMSNTGRIVVKKRIAKIEKRESRDFTKLSDMATDRNGKLLERKKKGRLYSLGGNEPVKKGNRGRLDRLKTVGTFDLGAEMCILSEVARNLNEKIISGELSSSLENSANTGLSISTIPSISTTSCLSTPNGKKRNISKSSSGLTSKNGSQPDTKATGNVYFSPNEMTLFDNRKQSNCKNVISTVKTQYSAEDYRIKSMSDCSGGDNMKAVNRKCRSLSTSSYLSKDNSDFLVHNKTVRNNAKYSDTVLVHSEELITKLSPKIGKNVVNSSKISNYSLSKGKEMQARDFETDSNKIQEDIRSVEDVNKKYQMSGEKTFTSKTRKPILRKSKRIVRTDSEILSDDALAKNEIVLQAFYDIQVHKEQNFLEEDNCDAASSVPAKQSKHSSIESGLKSSKESSDFDDICSPRGILKSTDDSSRNISTDELDAVFSDSTELQQLEKDFREQVRSNLQREYKSDGDTLDEIGKKRNEFGKWKNQSFDNDLDFLQEDTSASAVIVGEKPSVNKKVDSIEFFEKISRNESVHDQNIIEPIKSNQPSMETSFAPVRPTKLNMRSIKTGKNSHESSRSSIFENPFGKFKKMNKLLKCKRFSSSALYEKKKQQEIKESNKSNKVFSASPAKGALSDSKSSIYSSKISLFATKNFIFSGKKSPMFSNSSLSNSELYSKSSSKAKLNELSKSNSEISKYRASPSRYSIKRSSNETKTNSTTCLPDESAISPLSEEFYNKTGSVRLSAMELFEKFCSEDFGGLYKHENFKNDERYDHIGHYHGRRDVSGAMKKIGMPRNARLLKQKSEPKFHLKSDFGPDEAHGGGVMYFHEEEDESQCYDEQDEFYEDYEGEYEDSYYGEEDEEEVEDEENVEDDEIEEYYPEDQQDDIGKIQLSEIQERNVGPVLYSIKSFDEMSDQDDDDIYCGQENNDMIAIDSEVDEIYLMPDESKCGNMDFCFSPKENLSKETCLARTDGFEKDLNILNDEDRKLKKGYNVDQDEILTIYRICSVDNIVAPKVEITTSRSQQFDARSQSSHYFNKEPDMPATQANDSNCNSLELAVDQYLKNTPIDSLEIISATDLSIIKSDCIERADSMELLSASSGTAHSSTLTDYAFDTVKNLHLDSCSTSKLSLSLKSEVFDEFTLTPDEPKRISDFEFEDFTLTPEDSFSENAQNDEMLDSKLMGITGNDNIRSSDSATNVLSIENDDTQGDVLTIVDQFLSQERAQQESFEDQNSKYKATLLNRKEGLKKGGSLTNETFHRAPMLKKLSNKFIFKSVNLSDDVFLYDKSDKINFGEMSSTSTDIVDDAKQEDIVSDFTTELTKEFDLLFFQAEQSIKRHEDEVISKHSDMNQESKMPTRHSMQKLKPYFIGEKETPAEGIVANVESANDKHENSETCSRRQIYSQLGKNKSQSLGNLNKKTRCFPL